MAVIEKLTDLAKKLTGAKDAMSDLRAADAALRQAHDQAQQQRSNLLSRRPPKSELVALAHAQVDQIAAAWHQQWGDALTRGLAGSVDCAPDGRVLGLRPGDLLGYGVLPNPVTMQDLIALAPEAAKAAFTAAIESTDYPAGVPMTDRMRLLAEVDERIAQAEAAHTRLCDESALSGISIALLPDVAQRRRHGAYLEDLYSKDVLPRPTAK